MRPDDPKTSSVTAPLGAGQVLGPGVYNATSGREVGGSLTLDRRTRARSGSSRWWSTLITDTGTTIKLAGGAQACNVFWQVGSSATLNTGTTFVGTILASAMIGVGANNDIMGRLLASSGGLNVSIDDTITAPSCATTGGGGCFRPHRPLAGPQHRPAGAAARQHHLAGAAARQHHLAGAAARQHLPAGAAALLHFLVGAAARQHHLAGAAARQHHLAGRRLVNTTWRGRGGSSTPPGGGGGSSTPPGRGGGSSTPPGRGRRLLITTWGGDRPDSGSDSDSEKKAQAQAQAEAGACSFTGRYHVPGDQAGPGSRYLASPGGRPRGKQGRPAQGVVLWVRPGGRSRTAGQGHAARSVRHK